MPSSSEKLSSLEQNFSKAKDSLRKMFESFRMPPAEEVMNANQILGYLSYNYNTIEIAPSAMDAILNEICERYPVPGLQIQQESYDYGAPFKSLTSVPPERIGQAKKLRYDVWFTYSWKNNIGNWTLHWQRVDTQKNPHMHKDTL